MSTKTKETKKQTISKESLAKKAIKSKKNLETLEATLMEKEGNLIEEIAKEKKNLENLKTQISERFAFDECHEFDIGSVKMGYKTKYVLDSEEVEKARREKKIDDITLAAYFESSYDLTKKGIKTYPNNELLKKLAKKQESSNITISVA